MDDRYKQLEKRCVITEELYEAHKDIYTVGHTISYFETAQVINYLKTVTGVDMLPFQLFELELRDLFNMAEFVEDVEPIGKISFLMSSLRMTANEEDTAGNAPFINVFNKLYRSKKFDVVFGYMGSLNDPKNEAWSTVYFAKNDESARLFARHCMDLLYPTDAKVITHVASTSHGLSIRRVVRHDDTVMDDVLLDQNIKEEIIRSIDQFFNEDDSFYTKYKIPYKRGLLLYGDPGNGKTTLAKAISNHVKQDVFYWQVTEYTSSDSIAEVFYMISERSKPTGLAKSVLILEDVDSLPHSCRSTFLNYLDGSNSTEGVFIIATTNFPENVDPALMNRAGRFDRTYKIPLPTGAVRKEYLVKKGIEQFLVDEQLSEIMLLTEGFSIANLNEVFTSCALQFHYEGVVDPKKITKDIIEVSKQQKRGNFENGAPRPTMGFAPLQAVSDRKNI